MQHLNTLLPTKFDLNSLSEYVLEHKVAFFVSGTALLGAIYLWWSGRRARRLKLPPGPRPLAIVGLIKYGSFDPAQLLSLHAQYGDIISWKVLGQPVISLASYDVLREALVHTRAAGEPLAGRLQNSFRNVVRKINGNGAGIVGSDGEVWRVHRRFALHVLRDLGFGRSIAEQIIQEQADLLVEQLLGQPQGGQGPKSVLVDPQTPLMHAINDVISRLVFGDKCTDDPEFDRVISELIVLFRAGGDLIRTHFALLARLPIIIFKLVRLSKRIGKVIGYINKKVTARESVLPSDVQVDQTSSLIDAYLAEKRAQDAKAGPGKHLFSRAQVNQVAFEFFIAGTETTVSTLRWALLLMAKYPDVQKRVQEEIETVLGDRMPNMTDKTQMPYTEAVICEVQRYRTLVPFLARRVTEPCKVHGYDLPVGATVLPLLFAVHEDPRIWPVPDRFAPDENFLASAKPQGKSLTETVQGQNLDSGEQEFRSGRLVRTEYLVPFGLGKRECLGETLARAELFIFFVRLLQKFELRPPPEGRDSLSEKPLLQMPLRFAAPYKITLVSR